MEWGEHRVVTDEKAPSGGHPATLGRLHRIVSPEVEYRQMREEALRGTARLTQRACSRLRREIALEHPIQLGKVYAGHWFSSGTPPFHWEITDYAIRLNRFVVAAPVGSGKTVLLTKLLPLWSTLAEDVTEILLISNSNEMASGWLDEIKLFVDSSQEFREDFGRIQGLHWGSDELEFMLPHPSGRTRRCVIPSPAP